MKKCTYLGRFHKLEEFHRFLWSSQIFGVRKILKIMVLQVICSFKSIKHDYTRGVKLGILNSFLSRFHNLEEFHEFFMYGLPKFSESEKS